MNNATASARDPVVTEGARVNVLGCAVDALDLEGTVRRCLAMIAGDGGRQVSVNTAKIVMAADDPSLAQTLAAAELASADGVPVVWAARALGQHLPGRVNGTDLMERLLSAAAADNLSVYILGSREEVLAQAIAKIQERYPGVRRVSSHHGYFTDAEEDSVVADINSARPDILFLAMGSPKKEEWLYRNWPRLEVGLAMGVGGSIDVLAGAQRRAPRWMQKGGLEWFYRLLQEPRRMWRRYLVGNSRFIWMLAREIVRRRWIASKHLPGNPA
jgi:N-acetylglucosaminyldiphosphoundecaprenol N-acetyl-beta-D-mannosaminyltransferase